jgi:hypothetical protein
MLLEVLDMDVLRCCSNCSLCRQPGASEKVPSGRKPLA